MQKLGDELPVSDAVIEACEAAVCKVYQHNCADVNEVRYDMLSKGAESHQIPPTKDALILHTKRANYQAYVWKRPLLLTLTRQAQLDMGGESQMVDYMLNG